MFQFWRRLIARLVLTTVLGTLAVFAAIEASIDGGFRAVVLPQGINPDSPRDSFIVSEFNLDRPLLVRYASWLLDALQGDLGSSIRNGEPVFDIIVHRLPISLELALVGIVVAVVLGIPLGLFAALRDGRRSGQLVSAILGFTQSLPAFMAGTLLIWVVSVRFGLLPASGWTRLSNSPTGNLRGLILPVAALVLAEIGIIARVVRADVLRVLQEDYIVAAVGRGLPARRVVFNHALRPGSIGLLTVLGLNFSSLLAGVFVIEIVFGIGGLGQVLIEAGLGRDLNLLLGLTLYTIVVYVVVAALIDLALYWADPRIRRA